MSAPKWAIAILRRLAKPGDAQILIGDLEEAHHARISRRGHVLATVLTFLEAGDIALMLVRRRIRLPRLGVSWLDVKLGLRMLVRYPVLTVVGSGSLALAIALGAAAFAFITLMLWPRMPLPEGDRIVTVAVRDDAANQPESRLTADYLRWRAGTGTLTDFAATRAKALNLTMGDGLIEPVTVAEVTASMFAMTRVAPIMGRGLNDGDARADAPPVLVLGERIWRERFAADPGIIGKSVIVTGVPTAVVGVMPAGYRFPSVYEVWQPLKLDETSAPRVGVGIRVFARLKPGVTSAQANAELAVLSAQSAADWPATHAHLKAALAPAARSNVADPEERVLYTVLNLATVLLLLLVSGNVALLMFARAATRESEIVVRTALGASRGRLIAQFFAEALVLSAFAAVAGLWLAEKTMVWAVTTFAFVANDGQLLPFWITPSLPPVSIAYGVGLALLAAAMTGILPALKMTRGVSSRLRERTAGGGGLKFGGVWTVLIVSQIAVTVLAPSMVFILRRGMHETGTQQIGVPADQYLTARLGYGSGMSQAQFEAAIRRVRAEIAGAAGITHATLADKLPLMWNGAYWIEVDEGGAAPPDPDNGNTYPISTAAVQPDFFPAFDAPCLVGRLLVASDYGTARVAVVNQAFVEKVLGGRNAIGRRIRYQRAGNDGQRPPDATEQPWLEIVGVVRDLGMAGTDRGGAGAYLPLNLGAVNSVMIAARVSGDMTAATNALRSSAAQADRALRLDDVRPLSHVRDYEVRTMGYVARLFSIVSASALVLALSGIYAVMSFAVSRRTREIGIRVALGSSRPRVVFTILRRPLFQTAMGIVVGGVFTFLWINLWGLTPALALGTTGYIVIMFSVCLLACVVPARRALTIDPIAALRND
jgi:putative ABC transport system permease protein